MHGINRFRTTCKGIYRFRTADRQPDWGSGRQIGDLVGRLGIWQVQYIGDLEDTVYIGDLAGILGIWQVRYIGDQAGTVYF